MAGPITIAVLADVAKARQGINGVNNDLGGMGGKAGKAGKMLAAGFLIAGAAAVAVGAKLIQAGERAGTSNARIEQIASSMGLFGKEADNVSGRLIKLAEATALQTGVDQNSIKETQAKLLTFKELAKSADTVGGSFDRATAAAVDLEAAGFGSASSNAVQLGKALNDPIKGLTALNKQGITFTEGEKKRIETLVESNKVGEAQKLILGAIEKQVGGTAAATANATERMKVAFSLVMEKVGLALMPALDAFATFVIDTVLPAVSSAASWLSDKLGPAFSTVAGFVKQLTATFGGEGGGGLAGAVATVQAVFGQVVAVVGPIVQALVGLVRDNWSKIVAWTTSTFGQIRSTVASQLQLVRTVVSTVLTVVKVLWNRFGDDILSIVKVVFQTVGAVIKAALNIVQGIIRTVTAIIKGDWSAAWDGIKQILKGAWDAIVAIIKGVGSILKTVAAAAFNLLKDAAKAGIDKTVEMVKKLPGEVKAGLGALGGFLVSAGEDLIRGLITGVGNMAGQLVEKAKGVVGDAISAAKSKLGINSPSRVFAEIGRGVGQGMIRGMDGTSSDVRRSMQGLVDPSGLDVTLPGFRSRSTDPAATTNDKLDQLVAAIQALPRDYRLNERLSYS